MAKQGTGVALEQEVEHLRKVLKRVDEDSGKSADGPLADLFHVLGVLLQRLGRAVVLIDGKPFAVSPTASGQDLVVLAGEDPARYCAFKLNPCTGKPEKFASDPGAPIRDGWAFSISLCSPPQDGQHSRDAAIKEDLRALAAVGANAQLVALSDGREAILATFNEGENTPTVTLGTAVSAQYPGTGVDWALIETSVVLSAFAGQKKNASTTDGRALIEHSIHPASQPARASAFIIAVYQSRCANFSKAA